MELENEEKREEKPRRGYEIKYDAFGRPYEVKKENKPIQDEIERLLDYF